MRVEVRLADQSLSLFDADERIAHFTVSTASKGPGQRKGSEGTPLGAHVVRAKIGAGLPAGAVLLGRRPTGEIWTEALHRRYPERDWILSRVLWLSGCERGRNRLGDVDSMQRYIYIHGTPDCEPMGTPASHGCIRMRNHDVIELFDRVPVGTPVLILEGSGR